jgi:hypothetical protein
MTLALSLFIMLVLPCVLSTRRIWMADWQFWAICGLIVCGVLIGTTL